MTEQYEIIKRQPTFRQKPTHKEYRGPHVEKKCRKEGLNFLYKLSALSFLIALNKHPSLRIKNTLSTIPKLLNTYEEMLRNLSKNPFCLDYDELLKLGYMKRKHWIYATYIGLISSLPILYKISSYNNIIRATIAKASFGTSVKLLDNLNDNVHDLDAALTSLRNLLSAYTTGIYEPNLSKNGMAKAENSALEIGTWIYKMFNMNDEVKQNSAFELYTRDVRKLIMGQIDSLLHKDKKKSKPPTIIDYIKYILEKNIGDVWFDIDFYFFEDSLNGLTSNEIKSIMLMKQGISLIFKAAGIYDDVVDAYEDIISNSINSTVLLAIERGLLSYEDLHKIEPTKILKLLSKSGVFNDIIRLGDAVHMVGLNMIREGLKSQTNQFIDGEALIAVCNFIRLFSIRKYLIRERDFRRLLAFVKPPTPFITMSKDLCLLWDELRKQFFGMSMPLESELL